MQRLKMQQYKISSRLLNHFGLSKGMGTYWSPTCDDRKEFVKEEIVETQMLALIGERGIGKSTLFEFVKGELKHNTKFVYANDPDKERLQIGTVLTDVIEQIGGEAPMRSRAARKVQFTRIVGEFSVKSGQNVCLVIEEAHRLKESLYRALKELREAEYLGTSPLFSVVLIGHPRLRVKMARVEEVFLRSHILELSEQNGWLNFDERVEFLSAVFGRAIKPTIRRRIAIAKRLPLDMVNYVEQKMWEAYNAGSTQLDEHVIQPSPAEMYEAMKRSYPKGISYKIIADEINGHAKKTVISKTSVNDVLHQGNTHRHSKLVADAITRIGLNQEKITYSKAGNE